MNNSEFKLQRMPFATTSKITKYTGTNLPRGGEKLTY
jgi:hypothetical protein